jgi:Asp-tRNA(Asn)/Glu-tRNA(Gln) amidotransferase B subunit
VVYVKSKPLPQASDKNKFMGIIMKELKGKANGNLVKEVIDAVVV